MPLEITFTGNRKIQFVYDASGAKLRKYVNNNGTIDSTDYVNGVEYQNNILQRIPHSEGEIVKNTAGTYVYEYTLKDHLGNTRVTFGDANNDGTVENSDIKQINAYYPFGLNMEGPWSGGVAIANQKNKYGYNGKELNSDFGLGWSDFGARFYDAAIDRFPTVDPLAMNYKFQSPYAYAADNPIRFVDVMGMGPSDGDPNYNPSNDPSVHNENTYTVKGSAATAASSRMATSEMYNSLQKFWERSGNYARGVTNSLVSNLTLGFPGTRSDPNEEYQDDQDAEDFADGQTAGDIISTFVGTGEVILGTGVAGGSVLLEVPSLGISSVGVGAGTGVALHGAGVFSVSLNNLLTTKFSKNKKSSKGYDITPETGEKPVSQTIPQSVQKGKSWAGEYGHLTPSELAKMVKQGNKKAADMLKLYRDSPRLLDKIKNSQNNKK